MLHQHHFLKKSLCLILTLSLLLLPGCGDRQSIQDAANPSKTTITSTEENENSDAEAPEDTPETTISSADYYYPLEIDQRNDDELLDSIETQTFSFDCPIGSSKQNSSSEDVFVKLKLPEGWTQDTKNPALFFFPDGTKAMQIEILPLEKGQCIWSTERLWEDESCITYSKKYIHYSWNTFLQYTFYSVHLLDQPDRYDYIYYLPYGSAYFAVHFDTAGENNETALRFQTILLETIQLLTPIPSDQLALPSEETWKATVSLTTEEQTMELTLDIPVVWAQEKPGSSVFCDSDSVGCISSMSLIKLSPGQTVWDIVDEEEHLLQRTAVINGQEIPRLIFTPPYKPGEDSSEEFGVRRYYYYLPMEDHCLVIPFFCQRN